MVAFGEGHMNRSLSATQLPTENWRKGCQSYRHGNTLQTEWLTSSLCKDNFQSPTPARLPVLMIDRLFGVFASNGFAAIIKWRSVLRCPRSGLTSGSSSNATTLLSLDMGTDT